MPLHSLNLFSPKRLKVASSVQHSISTIISRKFRYHNKDWYNLQPYKCLATSSKTTNPPSQDKSVKAIGQAEINKAKITIGTVKIDRSGLIGGGKHSVFNSNYAKSDADDNSEIEILNFKETMSTLGKDLSSYIKMKGPITIHDYMSQTVNHIVHGYYQNKNLKKIGEAGDFITAPEISQLFGEMVAIWCLSAWENLGKPPRIKLIELGPGNGTLMVDILRVAAKFPAFLNSLNVHLVELSESMREMQRENLRCSKEVVKDNGIHSTTNDNDIDISWCYTLDQVAKDDIPILILGQEFLDAFPVHQFLYTDKGWREKLIDIDNTMDSKFHFRTVISPGTTPAIMTLMNDKKITTAVDTSHIDNYNSYTVTNVNNHESSGYRVGDGIEVAPMALAACEDIANMVNKRSGMALLFDYGENSPQGDTLRGYKQHKQVNILSEPGNVDITADVDFLTCAKVARKKGAVVFDAIGQGDFLVRMCIIRRLEEILELDSTTDEEANSLFESMKYLVEEDKMGKRFKVLSIASKNIKVPGFTDFQ